MAGQIPKNPSFYICALDRGQQVPSPDLERFEIITNAPATNQITDPEDIGPWLHQITQQMAEYGIHFNPAPTKTSVTTAQAFGQMFPASQGALYGQSPHGLTAALKRPTARTKIANLYLAGGGTHPGAGLPMATLSAQHAGRGDRQRPNFDIAVGPNGLCMVVCRRFKQLWNKGSFCHWIYWISLFTLVPVVRVEKTRKTTFVSMLRHTDQGGRFTMTDRG